MAIGEDIGHGKTGEPTGLGGLDDAHIGDVVAGQRIKAQAQNVIPGCALVMGGQNGSGHGALGRRGRAGQRRLLFQVGDQLAAVEIYPL